MEQLEVYSRVALDFAKHASERLPRCAPSIDVIEGLTPPVQARLADATLARDLPRPQHLKEEGIDGEVVWACCLREVSTHTECCVVKFLHIVTTVLHGMFNIENALLRLSRRLLVGLRRVSGGEQSNGWAII